MRATGRIAEMLGGHRAAWPPVPAGSTGVVALLSSIWADYAYMDFLYLD